MYGPPRACSHSLAVQQELCVCSMIDHRVDVPAAGATMSDAAQESDENVPYFFPDERPVRFTLEEFPHSGQLGVSRRQFSTATLFRKKNGTRPSRHTATHGGRTTDAAEATTPVLLLPAAWICSCTSYVRWVADLEPSRKVWYI